MNPELDISPRLAGQWTPKSANFCIVSTRVTCVHTHHVWGSCMGSGDPNSSPHDCASIYPLSHLQFQMFLTQGLVQNKLIFHQWAITITHTVNSFGALHRENLMDQGGSSYACNYSTQKAGATAGSQLIGKCGLYSRTLAPKRGYN